MLVLNSWYRITACEAFFELPSFGQIPIVDGPATETSQTLFGTSGAILLTEMLVMQSRSGA